VQTDLSSLDIARLLNAGYSLQLTPGTEAINLVDGVLSVGTDTNEAFIQRLYEGLLGRSYDAPGMEAWIYQMDHGATKEAVAAGFLASAEYLTRPQPADETAFIASLYTGFLGRAADAGGMAAWLSAPVQAGGNAWIVANFDDQPETKGVNAFDTSKVFARNEDATVLHEIYQTGLQREAELSGLAAWESLLNGSNLTAIADMIGLQPETLQDHGSQTDAAFVTDLYHYGTGQVPTDAQLGNDVARLQSGMTRGALLLEVASSATARAWLTSDNFGQPPIFDATAAVNVAINQPVSIQLHAQDPDRTAVTYGLTSGPSGATVDPTTGVFTWAGSPTPLRTTVTVEATDPSGLATQQDFALDVAAGAPTLSATGPGSALVATDTFVSLSQTGTPVASGATVTGWTVNWGDGSAIQTVSGASVDVKHDYATPGAYRVQAGAVTASFGTFAAVPVTVQVAPDTLAATSVTAETTGFHARFNGVLDPATLSVLSNASGDAPSVIVTGSAGIVPGSIVVDPDGAGFRFIAATGALPDGSYNVVLRGAVRDMRGRALDGDGDGIAGDDLTTNFSVHNDADTLAMPAFMRGPGQSVAVPAAASGLPISFTSDGTATSVVFTVAFDPALLDITGAVADAALPVGSTVGFVTSTLPDGRTRATITVQSPTAIAAGSAPLVDLVAQVPATAPYGRTEVLSLNIVSVNGVAQALPEASGLQIVGYLGDANGDGSYSSADGARILRVVGGADSGFAAWSGVAPSVVGDVNGDGSLTAADALNIAQTAPAIPGGITLVMNAATPFVSAPTNLQGAAGGMVTVPVTLDRSVALTSGTITLSYDLNTLTLTAVRADPSSGLSVQANPGSGGTVSVTVSKSSAAPVSGVLALFDFQVASGVQAGSLLIMDLSGVTLDGRPLNPQAGADGSDGRISVLPTSQGGGVIVSPLSVTNDEVSVPVSPTRLAQALLLGGEAA
jgi:hypothetical protein